MDVALNFKSSGIQIAGLDEALNKLQKLHDLSSTIGRKVVIDLQVNGAGQLVTATEQLQKLAAGLRLAGMNAQAGLLQGGLLSPQEMRVATDRIAKSVREQAAAVEREYKEAQARFIRHKTSFDALSEKSTGVNFTNAELEMMPKVREKIAREAKAMDAAYSKLGMFRQLEGMADALRGVDVATADAGQETKKFAEAASAAASPIQRETEAVEKQTVALTKLARAKSAARMGVVDSGGGSLISTKTTTTGKGEQFTTSAYRTADGLIRTNTGSSETLFDDKMRKFRERAAALQTGFGLEVANASSMAGRSAKSGEYAAALRKLQGEMGDLGGTVFGQGLLRKAGAADGSFWSDAMDRGRRDKIKDSFGARRDADSFWDDALGRGRGDIMKSSVRSRKDADSFWDGAVDKGRNDSLKADVRARNDERDKLAKIRFDEEEYIANNERQRVAREAAAERRSREVDKLFRDNLAASNKADEKRVAKEMRDAEVARRNGFLPTLARNTGKLAMWSLGTSALYGAGMAAGDGMGQAVSLDRQFATLGAVYRGGEFGLGMLADNSLRGAVAQGRGTDEAIRSAIKFSRLGLTEREVSTGVRVSLQAANVAEIGADEAGENLSAIMTSYALDVSALTGVLNEMNAVSNTLNVTVADLMNGIARTGAVAKQAGVPLSELIGLIGAGVGATGRPGAEFGNAIKSTIVSLSNPETQGFLKKRFNFDVFGTGGAQKDMSTVIRELFVMQSGLPGADKGELLAKIGGKNQASRLEAMLDNYLAAQEKSIAAQRALNSAQKEGERILNTTESKLASLGSAWGRMWSNAFQGGGKSMVNRALDNLTFLMEGADGTGGAGGFIGDVLSRYEDSREMGTGLTGMIIGGGRRQGARKDYNGQVLKFRQSDEGINAAYQSWQDAMSLGGADRQAALNASMFIENPGIATPENLRSLGRMMGTSVTEQEALSKELSGLSGSPDALKRRIEELRTKARESAEFNREAETARALVTESTMMRALDASRGRQSEFSAAGNLEAAAREQERVLGLEQQLGRFRGQRKNYADEEIDYSSAGLTSFRDTLSGRRGALDMLFGGAPMIGDFEMDKLRMGRRRADAVDAMAGSIDAAAASGRFGSYTLGERDVAAMSAEAGRLRTEADAARRGLAFQEPAAQALDAMRLGRESASRDMRQYGVGLNETQRLFNMTDGAMSGLGQTLSGLGGSGEQKTGAQIEYGNQLISARNEILGRQKSIMADIRNEQLKQNEEASKALLFASRGQQLQAALMTGYAQRKGRMSASQFMNMDEDFRQNALRFAPDIVPLQAQDRMGDLLKEKSQLDAGAGDRVKSIDGVIDRLKNETSIPVPPNMSVSVTLGNEFAGIADKMMQAVVVSTRQDIKRIESRVDSFIEALMAPAGGMA